MDGDTMAEAEELVKRLGTERYGGEGYAAAIKELAFKRDEAVVPLSNALKDREQPPSVRRGAALAFVRMAQEDTLREIPQESKNIMVDALITGLADREFGIDKECAFTLSTGLINSAKPELKDRAVKELMSKREGLGEWAFRVLAEVDYSGISQETRKQTLDALDAIIKEKKGKPDFDSEVRAAQKVIRKIEKSGDISARLPEKNLTDAINKKEVAGPAEKEKKSDIRFAK
jgi:hypothetical protein